MKRLLTLLALVLCSCAETFVGEEATRPNNENLPDLTAAFADEEATRTYIEEGKYLRWNEDDRLTIFFGNTLNRQYKFNGATGDNSGTFSLVPDGMLGTGNAFDHIYALYPYNADARITDEGIISLTLPAVQNYAENSFGRGANTMIAVTENVEDTFLSFKNACGYLKLKLYNSEGATIKSIEVKGNGDEKIAGAATATIAFGEAPVFAMADDATTSVTLNCGEGVALGTTAETATEFWVVLPATTFAEGLTITATDTEGKVFKKSTTKEVVIERNAIQPMAALEAECTPPGPADNEIWYTNGSTTEATTPYKTDVFGANIASNTYDAEKECWVITFDDNVTTIGDWAFSYCSSLTSVTIPDSVITTGHMAFSYCSSLTSVTITDSVTKIGTCAFLGCSSLTNITIPDSVTTIGDEAFYGCSSLTSVAIPDSVTTIGNSAFTHCSSLESVTIPDSVTSIGSRVFRNCTGNLFVNCNIPSASLALSNGPFDSSKFTSVTIGDSVTTIGDYAFYKCSSLTSLTIGDSVTTIGKEAFYDCTGELIVKCNIPSASYLPNGSAYGAFYGGKFTSVTIGDSVTTIGSYAFQHCSSLANITISDSVTSIGNYAFWGCKSLTSVTIPDSVTKIGYMTFAWCSSLISVTIPNGVTTIGDDAFEDCSSLESVTIPDSVTNIGRRAFYKCSSLTSVYCKATTPPVASSLYETWIAFDNNASGRKIYVPAGSVEAYKTAPGWSEYASYIQMSPYIPSECTSLTITADDVTGNDTTTTIYYTAVTNGVEGWGVNKSETITGTAISDEFPQNTSTTESIERTVSFTYLGQTATTTITQGPFVGKSYTISLNNAWRQSTSVSNPSSSFYDGVYESYSNYNKDNGVATMYIDIDGYSEFSIYVRSDAESSYDYVTVSELDSTSQKVSTSGKQNSGTALSNYTKVTYTGIDGGSHRIIVTYRKDGSVNEGTDRGYLIIPKNQ